MFKRHRRLSSVALAMACLTVLAACGSSDKSGSNSDGKPVSGGTLTRIVQGDPGGLDPSNTLLTPSSTFSNIALPIYDLLVSVDANNKVTGRLAESMTSTDNKVWTLKLRPNLKFSDNTALDATAVKQNLDRYRDPKANQTAGMQVATSIDVVDATTVTITLKAADPFFPRVLAGQAGMMAAPATIAAWASGQKPLPIGAGPFKITNYVPNTSYSYERNPGYWDSPRPYLDKMEFTVVATISQGFRSFEAGEANAVSYVPGSPEDWQDVKDAGFNVKESTQIGGNAFLFQNKKAPTDDVRVRQALTLAADLTNANEQAASGAETMASTLFPKDSPFYNGADVKQKTGDLAAAQKLIDEYAAEKGNPVTITLLTSPASQLYGEIFAQQFARLKNFKVNLVEKDSASMLTQFYAGDWNVAFGTIKGVDPSEELMSRLSCNSGRNNGKFCNTDVDTALAEAQASTDVATRKADYLKVEKILWEQNPFLLYSRLTVRQAFSKDVKGVTMFGGGDIDSALLWLSK